MSTISGNSLEVLPHALLSIDELFKVFKGREPVLFLDYDGTLAPIVSNPDKAVMSDETSYILQKLSSVITVAIVSGRDRQDVASKVGFDNLIYAGSHGYDIAGPGNFNFQVPEGKDALEALDQASENLRNKLEFISGAVVERKRFAIAVHYRNVSEDEVLTVFAAVENELKKYQNLKKGGGKKILELKPAADWHKGKAVLWLMDTLKFSYDSHIPVFIGDDITDEDALKSIKNDGVGILVGSHGQTTAATFRLDTIEEVSAFLEALHKKVTANQG